MRIIAYRISTNYTDEYLRIGEDTSIKYVHLFAKTIRVFKEKYLRAPNEDDTKRLMAMNDARSWPGMLESIDCMHWMWKNFPTAYGIVSTSAIIVMQPLWFKQWPWRICGFGMLC
jgi:hypothetical protein